MWQCCQLHLGSVDTQCKLSWNFCNRSLYYYFKFIAITWKKKLYVYERITHIWFILPTYYLTPYNSRISYDIFFTYIQNKDDNQKNPYAELDYFYILHYWFLIDILSFCVFCSFDVLKVCIWLKGIFKVKFCFCISNIKISTHIL